MAKDKNEASVEKGKLLNLPDQYFDNVSVEETLDFLNDGARFEFQAEVRPDKKGRVVDPIISKDQDDFDSQGESIGVSDFRGGYVSTSKKKREAQKQKSYSVGQTEDEDDDRPIKRRESDGIQIVDVPIEIRPSAPATSYLQSENSGNSPYKTMVIDGEKVVCIPMDMVMGGGLTPFGMAQNITINPQTVTINPQTVTMNPSMVTMNPSVVTMNPETVTMNPSVVTMNPETVTMNPGTVTMNPGTVNMNPETVNMNPGVVNMNPEVVQMRPEVVQMKADSVRMKADSVETEAAKFTAQSGVVNAAETELSEDDVMITDAEELPPVEREETLSEKAGYKLSVEDTPEGLGDGLANSISTRVVGEIKKDGVVFFSNASANAAIESGLRYGGQEKEEEKPLPETEKAESEKGAAEKAKPQRTRNIDKFSGKAPSALTETFDTEEYKKAVEPEIVELNQTATPAPVTKKKSFLGRLWDKILGLFGGKKKGTETVRSLPAGSEPKEKAAVKEKKNHIDGAERLESVYDYFG